MQSVKQSVTGFVTVVVTAGLLYSPLCNLKCALSDCSLSAAATPADKSRQSGHCHHDTGSENDPSEPQEDAPSPPHHNDSHRCPLHADVTALLPSWAGSAVATHQQAPVVVVDSSIFSNLPLGEIAADVGRGSSLRAPPKRESLSVYRI